MQPQYNAKIIILGDSAVGKSSTLWRYMNPHGDYKSQDFSMTLGVDFLSETKSYKGNEYYVSIWDTAGQEAFKSMLPSYVKGSNAVVYIFDLSRKESFESVKSWHSFFLEHISENAECPCLLLGNKCDINDREVTSEEGEEMAEKIGAQYFEISAMYGTNVQESFHALYEEVFPLCGPEEAPPLSLEPTPKRSSCC